MATLTGKLETFSRHSRPPRGSGLPLPQGEVGAKRRVRGHALSIDRNPSPGFLASSKSDLSLWERRRSTLAVASVAGIALLGPGIAAVVIAAHFPIARRIVLEEFDALQPLRAFPEIEVRHHQPHRTAVFLLQRRARPAMRE